MGKTFSAPTYSLQSEKLPPVICNFFCYFAGCETIPLNTNFWIRLPSSTSEV